MPKNVVVESVKKANLIRSASPPAPSKNANLAKGHEELEILKALARMFLTISINMTREARHGEILWNLFEDSTFHSADSTSPEQIRKFLQGKLDRD